MVGGMPRRQDIDGADIVGSVSQKSRGSSPSPFATASLKTLLRLRLCSPARRRSLRLRATEIWPPGFSFSICRNVVVMVLLSPLACHIIPIDRIQLEF